MRIFRKSSRDDRDRDDRHKRDSTRDRNRERERSHNRDKYREKERDRERDRKRDKDYDRENDKYDRRKRSSSSRSPSKRRSSSPRDRKEKVKSRSPFAVATTSTKLPTPPPPLMQPEKPVVREAIPTISSQLPICPPTITNISSMLEKARGKAQQLEKMGIDISSVANRSVGGIEIPSYYNPGVVNPTKYVEQMKKRKQLWSNKKTEQDAAKWESAKFSQDQDGKVANKFMRLMGIKDPPPVKATEETPGNTSVPDLTKKQEELFSTMEQQYEVARQVTHTMRGVGFGFGSQPRPF